MLDEHARRAAVVISQICGWVYFLAWSLSFWPQPILNFRRRATDGLTADFPLLNMVGFASYTISTAAFLYSPVIRAEYAARHPRSPEPAVQPNDLAFGAHALALCLLTVSQFCAPLWGWKAADTRFRPTKVTLAVLGVAGLAVAASIGVVLATHGGDGSPEDAAHEWAWIDVMYVLTYIKLLLTVFKYMPQAVENWRRKSTRGWAMTAIYLDVIGGVLSLAQLIIDCSLQADWSGLTGNPVKLGLANISLLFDAVFLLQHLVLYGPADVEPKSQITGDEEQAATESDPLLR